MRRINWIYCQKCGLKIRFRYSGYGVGRWSHFDGRFYSEDCPKGGKHEHIRILEIEGR